MAIGRKFGVCIAALASALMAAGQENKLTAQDIVARHLESIGPAAARAGVKSRSARAATQFDVIIGSPTGHAEGSSWLVSLDRRMILDMRYPGTKFPDERIVYDGKNVQVAIANTPERTGSWLGDFLYRHNVLMSEGLFSGALRVSWPLLDVAGRQPKLRYQGLKKIDGRELHDLTYEPKKRGDSDLIIHLYFEPDTFRHVKTVYTFSVERGVQHQAELTRNTGKSGPLNREDTRYRVEEIFSDFRPVDGLTLPARWKVTYTSESSSTVSTAWEFTLGGVAHNNVTE